MDNNDDQIKTVTSDDQTMVTNSTDQKPTESEDTETLTLADNTDAPAVNETSIAEAPEMTETAEEAAEVFEAEKPEAEVESADEDLEEESADESELAAKETEEQTATDEAETAVTDTTDQNPNAKWYVVHTFSGHENKVATNLRQRIESEHLENRIIDILVPTQDKIEIRGGKKEQVKEKIFPGYILVKMDLDDAAWLAVRTTQGVTAFVGMNNKPTPISEREVASIVKFMTQGAPATFKDVFMVDDTVRIVDGPFTDFIGKVESVDKEKGKVRVLVSIFGRETPVELDFLQVTKL